MTEYCRYRQGPPGFVWRNSYEDGEVWPHFAWDELVAVNEMPADELVLAQQDIDND